MPLSHHLRNLDCHLRLAASGMQLSPITVCQTQRLGVAAAYAQRSVARLLAPSGIPDDRVCRFRPALTRGKNKREIRIRAQRLSGELREFSQQFGNHQIDLTTALPHTLPTVG